MMESKPRGYAFHNDHAKNCDPCDYWGQIRRTINGKPVGEEQIQLIVDSIVTGLALDVDDIVLDLCCGNGALTDRIFERCSGGIGVDFAEYLIAIAKANFERSPSRLYELSDVTSFVQTALDTTRFTKVLCYGAFQYLAHASAKELLSALSSRYRQVTRVFIGNLPDKARMDDFYTAGAYVPGAENDNESPLGIWRSETEFAELSASAGWVAHFQRMPGEFYAAHYRYDVVLMRP